MTVRLRRASSLDAGSTGWILQRFAIDTEWMPVLQSEAEAISFCGVMIDRGWVTVAERDGEVIGFLARDGAVICSLYLAPGACGQGVGQALLQQAKTEQPQLWLQAFVANVGAQRFYRREGFVETARSDGQSNEERLPDIRFEWSQAIQKTNQQE
ncbi:GNAT family N-acetyltransferase [Pseudophaeobacter sp.]|uniref:GNAT family N-acetyltransferase n=1 Tax=Pseudophaeobacter sp. TaxID=1971739 RepID=UPI003299EA04